jgi:ribonuclease BN (tRNA processing enzyme)
VTQPLDLLFLGSGNAFAPGRYWSSVLVNGRALFDCCPVVLPHLKMAGVPPADIEVIFVSHFHGDHFFGLPFLLLEYAELTPRERDLTIIGPPGIKERLIRVTEAGFPNVFRKDRGYGLHFLEAADALEGEAGSVRFIARRVQHVADLECFGFRAEVDGRTVAYSGDSMLCDALTELGEGADAFVLECTCWGASCGPHLDPEGIRELRRRLGPDVKFILTHLESGDQNLDVQNTLVASDLARFTI